MKFRASPLGGGGVSSGGTGGKSPSVDNDESFPRGKRFLARYLAHLHEKKRSVDGYYFRLFGPGKQPPNDSKDRHKPLHNAYLRLVVLHSMANKATQPAADKLR